METSKEYPAHMLSRTLSILSTQSSALNHLINLYSNDNYTQTNFAHSISLLQSCILKGGKIVITGVGKSLKIADKLVVTLHSLSIPSNILHPSDALHGDLGLINESKDLLLMITASGETPELINMLKHLSSNLVKICLTCVVDSNLALKSNGILHVELPKKYSEKVLYGLPAPTISTTLCLIIGDAACITLAELLVKDEEIRKENFGKHHPGGLIGKTFNTEKSEKSISLKSNLTTNIINNNISSPSSSISLVDFVDKLNNSCFTSDTSVTDADVQTDAHADNDTDVDNDALKLKNLNEQKRNLSFNDNFFEIFTNDFSTTSLSSLNNIRKNQYNNQQQNQNQQEILKTISNLSIDK